MMYFLRVELKTEKGVFIVGADLAAIRPSGPFQRGYGGHFW
jgi:hypothetical protein